MAFEWKKSTDEEKGKEINQRLKQLEDIRQPYEALIHDIRNYLLPNIMDMNVQDGQEGKKRGQYVYDGSASSAHRLLSDGLHGYLVNAAMRWYSFKIPFIPSWKMSPAIKQWLENSEEQCYSAFQRSNFYEQMSMYFHMGSGLGQATMYSEEDIGRGRTVYTCCNWFDIYIAENKFGEVDTHFRKIRYTARQAVDKFGKDAFDPTDEVIKALENEPYKTFEFIHAVFPRTDFDSRKADKKNKPWMSVWKKKDGNKILLESGYDENPYVTWRWRLWTPEIYGRGPGSDALIDIIKLQSVNKDLLDASHLATWGLWNVPMSMRGKFHIRPKAINWYTDQNQLVTSVGPGANYSFGKEREDAIKKVIEDHFQVEFFLMLARSERQMTAYEVSERQGEKAAVMGAAIGRLSTECLNPEIDRAFAIELRAGRIDPPPEELVMQFGGRNLEVDYMGPLAQAQKRLFKMQGINSSMTAATPFLQIFPESVDNVDSDELIREILEAGGMPARVVRPVDEVKKIRTARQQAQQAQNQVAMMMEAAKTVPNLSQPVDKDSPLAAMVGGAA